MKQVGKAIAAVLLLVGVFACAAAPVAAQNTGKISGTVLDKDAKPFPGVVVTITNEQGQKFELKTDAKGNYSQSFLRTGMTYTIAFSFNNQKFWEVVKRVEGGRDEVIDINVKELLAKQSAERAEEVKKQEEEAKKFEGMKGHFDAGRAALDEAKLARAEMQKLPADQRAPLQEKVAERTNFAISELQAAQQAAPEKEPNLHIVLAKLGEAYDAVGRSEEAAGVYEKAIQLKPDQAAYYNNLGNALARLGKIPEAMAAYEKGAALDPTSAAMYWRNAGIVLFNAQKMKEAIEPLKKSVDLDPKNAQAWYLLGASLVNTMGMKTEGDKVIPILQPGTVEAYEKCIELDGNGSYGRQCTEGLEALKQMGLGIQTKVRMRPPKKSN